MPPRLKAFSHFDRVLRVRTVPELAPTRCRWRPSQRCRHVQPPVLMQTRGLHVSPVLYKKTKGGKQDSGTSASTNIAADPNDFSQLQTEIAKAQTLMQENLSKLRSGGRFNHELLEDLRVQVDKKDPKSSVKLGDLAQVVPRSGRQIVILVGEQDYVKPINTAVINSPYSLNPTTNPQNPLELQLAIPPPTAESRKQVIAEADKAGEKTLHTIRQARGAQQKKMNAMEKAREVRPDDMRKARQNMEKLVETANNAVKDTLSKAKKALEG